MKIGETSIIAKNVIVGKNVRIGDFSIIGNEQLSPTIIGNDVDIGDYCKITGDVKIGNNCSIEDGCYIYKKTELGENVRILTGSKIFGKSTIGSNSIINGNVSQRVTIEENVRFFGRIAHSHRNHTLDWKTTVEKSPVFRKGCFVGIGALIIGPIEIGENAYVGAGEVVRYNVPANHAFLNGKIIPKNKLRGLII